MSRNKAIILSLAILPILAIMPVGVASAQTVDYSYCPTGYYLSNGECYSNIESSYTSSYNCPTGDYYSNGYCYSNTQSSYTNDPYQYQNMRRLP